MLHLNLCKRENWLSKPINLHSPTLNTAIWPTNSNWYIKGLPCWVYSRWIWRTYNLLFEGNCLQVPTFIFDIFCHLKIVAQSYYLYFSADANLQMQSVENRCGPQGIPNVLGEEEQTGVPAGRSRYERVSTGQFWPFIGGTEDPCRAVAWHALCARNKREVLTIRKLSPPLLIFCPLHSPGQFCQLIHSHKLIPN